MSNIYNLATTKANPFADTFDGGVLDFDVTTSDIFLDPYRDDLPISLPSYPSTDKKAVCKLDEDGTIKDWWVVGRDYPVKSHRNFYGAIESEMLENMDPNDVADVKVVTKVARNGRWGLRDYTFPNIQVPITTTKGHDTTISLRIVAWSGLDGGTANNYMLGAFDNYCTNGMVFSEASDPQRSCIKSYKRNTKNFSVTSFAHNLQSASETFYRQASQYQRMASSKLHSEYGHRFIESMKMSQSKREGIKVLYDAEIVVRGNNVFALHSALTNYSSHASHDLFRSRTTKVDVQAESMFRREGEVSDIFSSPQWLQLAA